jgi:hypothetical protein
MPVNVFPASVSEKFEIFDWRNATAIFAAVHRDEFDEVVSVLSGFELSRSWIEQGGGNKSETSKFIDRALGAFGWIEKSFDTRIVVDGHETVSPTHSVDCYKNKVALEVEWNNKDPFYDRDLNNFRLLYDLQIIDLGVIITRATALEQVLKRSGRNATTFGKATTHTEKLYPKIKGGGAGGCPVLVFGIKPEAYRDDR